MFFFFTCGTHSKRIAVGEATLMLTHETAFTSALKGYENVTVQCQNCGNVSGRVYKRWEWFTFCFIPIIPFSLKPWKEVGCHICNFYQDIKFRPDVTGGAGSYPMQPQHAGPGGPPPGQYK